MLQHPQQNTLQRPPHSILIMSACTLYLFGFAPDALAQFTSEKGGDGWTVELGMAVENEAVYSLSNDRVTELSPSVGISYRNGRTMYFTTIADYGLYHSLNRQWVAGVNFGLESGRKASDHPALTGLGNVDDTIELRFDVLYRATQNASIAARAMTAGAGKGEVFFLVGLYDLEVPVQNLELKLRADASWTTREHLTTEYGVSAEQAAASGYSQYQPASGLKSVGIALSGRYTLGKNWFATASLAYETFGSIGRDSPFASADYESEVEIGLGYRF